MPVVHDGRTNITFGWNTAADNWGVATNNSLREIAYVGIHKNIIDWQVNVPPTSPAIGDSYLTGSAPTGSWAGVPEGTLMVWGYDRAVASSATVPAVSATVSWQRFTPKVGYIVYVQQLRAVRVYNGSIWEELQNTGVNLRIGNTLTGDLVNSELNVANPFTDADEAKLDGIETGATRDQSASQIRDSLQGLSGSSRLRSTAVQGLSNGSSAVVHSGRIRVSTTRVKLGTIEIDDAFRYFNGYSSGDPFAMKTCHRFLMGTIPVGRTIDLEYREPSNAAVGATSGAGNSIAQIRLTSAGAISDYRGWIRTDETSASPSTYGETVWGHGSYLSGSFDNLRNKFDVWFYLSGSPITIYAGSIGSVLINS